MTKRWKTEEMAVNRTSSIESTHSRRDLLIVQARKSGIPIKPNSRSEIASEKRNMLLTVLKVSFQIVKIITMQLAAKINKRNKINGTWIGQLNPCRLHTEPECCCMLELSPWLALLSDKSSPTLVLPNDISLRQYSYCLRAFTVGFTFWNNTLRPRGFSE